MTPDKEHAPALMQQAADEAVASGVASLVPDYCSGMSFAFSEGVLHINKNGSGYIAVDEDRWELEDDRTCGPDGAEGSLHWITRFPVGELDSLRDYLNGVRFEGDLEARLSAEIGRMQAEADQTRVEAYEALQRERSKVITLAAQLAAAEKALDDAEVHTTAREDGRVLTIAERVALLAAKVGASEASIDMAVEALTPFAEAANMRLCGEWRDDQRIGQTDAGSRLTFGHIRAARAALRTLLQEPSNAE